MILLLGVLLYCENVRPLWTKAGFTPVAFCSKIVIPQIFVGLSKELKGKIPQSVLSLASKKINIWNNFVAWNGNEFVIV